jgi:hypothetical protein
MKAVKVVLGILRTVVISAIAGGAGAFVTLYIIAKVVANEVR